MLALAYESSGQPLPQALNQALNHTGDNLTFLKNLAVKVQVVTDILAIQHRKSFLWDTL